MVQDPSAFALLDECVVRAALRDRDLRFRLLAPAFPALGVGVLRVLRAKEIDGEVELVVGYDRYERRAD